MRDTGSILLHAIVVLILQTIMLLIHCKRIQGSIGQLIRRLKMQCPTRLVIRFIAIHFYNLIEHWWRWLINLHWHNPFISSIKAGMRNWLSGCMSCIWRILVHGRKIKKIKIGNWRVDELFVIFIWCETFEQYWNVDFGPIQYAWRRLRKAFCPWILYMGFNCSSTV